MIEIESLEAWYGEAQALRGVSLRVEAGEIITLTWCRRMRRRRSSVATRAAMRLESSAGSAPGAASGWIGRATGESLTVGRVLTTGGSGAGTA